MIRKLMLVAAMASFVVGGSVAYAAGDPVIACRGSKAKCVCKKTCARIKAITKNEKKPDAAKFAAASSKLESKYTRCMNKADAKGGCPAGASVATLEQKVDDFVDDVLTEIGSPSGAFLN